MPKRRPQGPDAGAVESVAGAASGLGTHAACVAGAGHGGRPFTNRRPAAHPRHRTVSAHCRRRHVGRYAPASSKADMSLAEPRWISNARLRMKRSSPDGPMRDAPRPDRRKAFFSAS